MPQKRSRYFSAEKTWKRSVDSSFFRFPRMGREKRGAAAPPFSARLAFPTSPDLTIERERNLSLLVTSSGSLPLPLGSHLQVVSTVKAGTEEEKLLCLQQALLPTLISLRASEKEVKAARKQMAQAVKEKEKVLASATKRDEEATKLRDLCRELERRNREIKEETVRQTTEMEKRRSEAEAKIRSDIEKVSGEIEAISNDRASALVKNKELAEENLKLQEILQSFQSQVDKMNDYHDRRGQVYDKEKELLLAKMDNVTALYEQEKARADQVQAQLDVALAANERVKDLVDEKLGKYDDLVGSYQQVVKDAKKRLQETDGKLKMKLKEEVAWKQREDDLVGQLKDATKILVEQMEKNKGVTTELVVLTEKNNKLEKLCKDLLGKMKLDGAAAREPDTASSSQEAES